MRGGKEGTGMRGRGRKGDSHRRGGVQVITSSVGSGDGGRSREGSGGGGVNGE